MVVPLTFLSASRSVLTSTICGAMRFLASTEVIRYGEQWSNTMRLFRFPYCPNCHSQSTPVIGIDEQSYGSYSHDSDAMLHRFRGLSCGCCRGTLKFDEHCQVPKGPLTAMLGTLLLKNTSGASLEGPKREELDLARNHFQIDGWSKRVHGEGEDARQETTVALSCSTHPQFTVELSFMPIDERQAVPASTRNESELRSETLPYLIKLAVDVMTYQGFGCTQRSGDKSVNWAYFEMHRASQKETFRFRAKVTWPVA